MIITKYGHCCLLIDINGVRILTDPGSFSTTQREARDVDVVLITHEHGDHLHVDSLREVLANNSNAEVVTNPSVMKILEAEGVVSGARCHSVPHGEHIDIKGILIEGFGTEHAQIYKEYGQVENTGYFIDGTLFYPGDAFCNPERPVDILALPVAGPWCAIGPATEYALRLKPRVAFPVHDAPLIAPAAAAVHTMLGRFLSEADIQFISLSAGETKEF